MGLTHCYKTTVFFYIYITFKPFYVYVPIMTVRFLFGCESFNSDLSSTTNTASKQTFSASFSERNDFPSFLLHHFQSVCKHKNNFAVNVHSYINCVFYVNMIYRSAPFSMTLVTPNPEVIPIYDTEHFSSLTLKYKNIYNGRWIGTRMRSMLPFPTTLDNP